MEERGSVHAGLLYASPTRGSTPGERFLALALAGARQRLYIANSYFVPDDDLRRLLRQAASRGVDVRILTVGDQTDVRSTWYAGRYRYTELLRAGIRIYEYQPTMMHAKTIVADGLFVTIGSMNFDNRSIAFNNETNLVVMDEGIAQQMEQVFADDLQHAREITLDNFRRRGWRSRMAEPFAALIARLL
jgi:cardiolipin synthase A/B